MQKEITHDLTATERQFFLEAREREEKLRGEYWTNLGRAKEAEMALQTLIHARDQQAVVIAKNAGLPEGRLMISLDATQLLVIDPVAPPPVDKVNGLAVELHDSTKERKEETQ